MSSTKFYQKLTAGQLRCKLCHHYCNLKPNELGVCGIRMNNKGEMVSCSYGRPMAQNIDPIEKKPLYHFLPGSLAYSIGTLGCNFKCANCQNYRLSQVSKIKTLRPDDILIEPQAIVNSALAENCRSIAFTYNEPTVFAEYGLDIMKLARAKNLKNIWVTNGYMSPECLSDLLPCLDAVNVDLKSFSDEFYRNNCHAKLAPVLDNIKSLKLNGVHLEITTLIIPGLTDDMSMIAELAKFIANQLGADTPWHLTKFSAANSWKLVGLPDTPETSIYQAYDLAREAGLDFVYAGNLPGDQRENTYCPNCRQLAVARFNYVINRFDNNGECAYCEKNLDIIEN